MPDCSRGQIPDELIVSKGRFKCDADFAPIPDINGVVPDLEGYLNELYWNDTPGPPNFNPSCGLAGLYNSTGGIIPLKNQSYTEELSIWSSDVLNVPNAAPTPSRMVPYTFMNPSCDGLGTRPNHIPASCFSTTNVEANFYVGSSFNVGLYGSTIQYFFYLYKVYCCTYDQQGNVIDFDYFFYFATTHNSSKYGFMVESYGPINFCSPGTAINNGGILMGVRL